MAQVTLTIPDAFMTRVIETYTNDFRYQETIPNPDFDPEQPEDQSNPSTISNTESQGAFTKRMVGEEIKGRVLRYEAGVARRQGIDAIKTDIESQNIT